MCFAGAALSVGWLIGAGVCAIGVGVAVPPCAGATWGFEACANAASETRLASAATAKCFFIRDLRGLNEWIVCLHEILTFEKNPPLTGWPGSDADLIIFDDFAKRSSRD